MSLPRGYYVVLACRQELAVKANEVWGGPIVGGNPSETYRRGLATEACERAAEAIDHAMTVLAEQLDDEHAAGVLERIRAPHNQGRRVA